MRNSFTLRSFATCSPGDIPDSSTRSFYKKRKRAKIGIAPSELVIQNILNYSRALSVVKTRETGCVNLLMN